MHACVKRSSTACTRTRNNSASSNSSLKSAVGSTTNCWRRGDFAHQHSRRIVDSFDLITVEDLAVNRMTHTHYLAKSIHDAAWSQFADLLAYKAAWAGRRYVAVNPASTSQDCSQYGHRQPLSLSDRIYICPCCGIILDRDYNASLNMLRLGQQSLASA